MQEIFKCVSGSHLYGTNIETSDTDYKGIFVLPKDDYLRLGFPKQIDHNKDFVSYEVGRFLQLLMTGNPNMIDLLFVPDKFILSKHPLYDLVLQHRDKFITKECRNSFVGYAIGQIRKARALDKKLNWEQARIDRKTVLDFCYVIPSDHNFHTIELRKWLKEQGKEQRFCGLSKVTHGRDLYHLFYDHIAEMGKEEMRSKQFNYHGIVSNEDTANDVHLSDVPKYANRECIMLFNKDAYSIHCKDYQSYQEWLSKRNTDRYKQSSVKDQQIDAKNLMHCRRLLDMAIEIAETGKVNVYRENKEELLKIRKGDCNLKDILEKAENDVERIDELFNNSHIPDTVDREFVDELLVKIRSAEK